MRKEIVALILENKGKFLVEKRKNSKLITPGAIIFPAGHVEANETKQQAIIREMKEELGITIHKPKIVFEGDFDCEEKQRIYWYKCEYYEGKIQNNEAEELLWIDTSESNKLTHQISKDALNAYLKD